jgi:hypothetical protein
MAEQRSHVGKVVVEQLWRPSCEAAYVCVNKHKHIHTGWGLLFENLARRVNEGDPRISCRAMVFCGVLIKLPGTYGRSELGGIRRDPEYSPSDRLQKKLPPRGQ